MLAQSEYGMCVEYFYIKSAMTSISYRNFAPEKNVTLSRSVIEIVIVLILITYSHAQSA